MYWPITTSPLCAPAEGSPAVSQQGHRRTIDWGVVLFLQADPHSCSCLLRFLHPNLPLSAHYSPSIYLFFLSACSLFISLPACLSLRLFPTSVSLLSVDCRQATLSGLSRKKKKGKKKINGIVLIQTDIKRHRASKLFLCRLIISPCFSTPFIFLPFGHFDLLFRGLLWASLAQRV